MISELSGSLQHSGFRQERGGTTPASHSNVVIGVYATQPVMRVIDELSTLPSFSVWLLHVHTSLQYSAGANPSEVTVVRSCKQSLQRVWNQRLQGSIHC